MPKKIPSTLFLDQSNDLIWMIDPDFNLVYANKAYLNLMKEVTGEEKELNTPFFVEGFGESYIKRWKSYCHKALSGDTFTIEDHFLHPGNNEIQYGHISFSPIKDKDGKILSVACRNTDVTNIVKEKYRASSLMDASLDVFCTIDEEGNFVYVSAASAEHWGYLPEELIGTPYRDLIVEEDLEKTDIVASEIMAGKDYKSFNNRFLKKNGDIAYNLWSASWDDEGKLMYCVARDGKETIERQQLVERSEERFKALVQEGSDLIGILDPEGNYTYVSPTSTAVLGIPPEAFVGKNAFDFIHRDDAERTLQYLQQITVDKKVQVPPFRFQNKEGEWRWIETVLTNMIDNPAINGIVANSRDVTEKRQEEQQLKLLSSVITNTNDAVLITEAEPVNEPGPRIIYVNEAFTKMTGYTPEEVIGKTPRILQGPKSNTEELAKLGEALRNWQPYQITTLNYKKNGEEFWINFTVTPVADETGWYTHWIAIERDVTAQKNAELEKSLLAQVANCFREEELKQAGEALCEVIRDFGDFDLIELWCPNLERTEIVRMATSTGLKSFNKENNAIGQFTKGEGLPGTVWDQKKQLLWDQDKIEKSFLRKNEAQKEGLKYLLGVPILHYKEINGVLLIGTNNDEGDLEKLSDIIQNLETFIGSEINRKKLEDDLKHLYEAIPEILCIADFKGRFLKINPAGCKLLGYSEEEILLRSFDEFTHPEDKGMTANEVKKLEQGGTTFQFENRFITKEGKIIWLSWSCNSSVQDGLIYAAAKDITTEKELRQLNKQANTMAKIGSWEVDLEKGTVFWSEMVHQMHETNPNTFVPDLESAISFYREDYREIVGQSVERAINTGGSVDFEAVIVTQNLNERWVKAIGDTEVVDGITKRFFGSFQDITERKIIELRLKSLTDDLPGVSFQYRVSPEGKDSRHLTSKAAYKIWGVSPEESEQDVDIVWDQIRKGGDFEKVQEAIEKSISSGEKWHCQWRNVLPSGELRWHEGFGTPNYLADGTVIFNSMIFDITDEKKAVLLYQETADTARMGTWEVDLKTRKAYFSKVTREIHELEEDIELSFEDGINFYKEEYREIVREIIQKGIENDEPWEFELPIITATRNERWVRGIGQAQKVDDEVIRIYGSIQDIHERKITELRLQSIANDLPGVTFQYHLFPDGTDRLYTVSKGAEKVWGLTAEESEQNINLVWDQIKKGGDYEKVVQDITDSIKTKTQWHSRWRNVLPSGKIRWHQGFGTPHYQPDGTVVFNSMIFDITEEQKSKEQILEANERFEKVTEATSDAIWDWDIVNDTFYRSQNIQKFFGKETATNLNRQDFWSDAFHPGDLKAVKESISKALKNKKTKRWEVEYRIFNAEGNTIYVVDKGLIIRDSSGKAIRMIGAMTDITELKSANIELTRQAEFINTMTDSQLAAIVACNADGELTLFNKTAKEWHGVDIMNVAQDKWSENYDLYRKDGINLLDKSEIPLLKALHEEKVKNDEIIIKKKNDNPRIVICNGASFYDKKGQKLGAVVVMTDITERKQSEKQLLLVNQKLETQTQELERSNEELEQFAFITSHDLQEPLRMISSFMDQLERKYADQLDDKAKEYIHFAKDGAKRMKQIILDLLLYSRVNRPAEEKEAIHLNEIVSEFLLLRRKLIAEKKAVLNYDQLPDVKTYRAPITQLFHCLLDNALKYTRENVPPVITVQVTDKGKYWEFAIKDNGIGIDERFYDKVFIIFQRLHNRKEYDGTGIGLSIAKRAVEFLGGEIWVKSELEEGSTFYFTISKTANYIS